MTAEPVDGVAVIESIPPLAWRTVAVDFDGVIHSYTKGFHDGTCYDVPMPGAVEALAELMETRPVVVMTARPVTMVAEWLHRHMPNVPLVVDHDCRIGHWASTEAILVTNRKIVAQHYIDDRAVRFVGSWPITLTQMARHELAGHND